MFSEYYCQKYFLVLIFRGPHVCGLVPIVSVGDDMVGWDGRSQVIQEEALN